MSLRAPYARRRDVLLSLPLLDQSRMNDELTRGSSWLFSLQIFSPISCHSAIQKPTRPQLVGCCVQVSAMPPHLVKKESSLSSAACFSFDDHNFLRLYNKVKGLALDCKTPCTELNPQFGAQSSARKSSH
ncbi:hypothetical protein N7G274_002972 [Stereocaulon virgatum]|uniref:Uncharacterized protein n=1 Tax=Stereocaulon virgatum TaxID=373712 RepID=A0ABR4AI13_9LECA